MASSFTRFIDHTQRRTTVGRTSLDEWSAPRRDLYLTTHNTHSRQTSMPPGGIRTHDLSRRAAVDLRLRPRGHWDRHFKILHTINKLNLTQFTGCIVYLHFPLHSAFGKKSLCTYKEVLEVMSTSVYRGLNPFNFFTNTFCRSACEMFLMYRSYCSF